MAKPKPRKRPYIQPPSEVTDRERPRTRVVKAGPRSGDARFYTAPNGRKMPVPAAPSIKRSLKQLPLYFVAMAVVVYFTSKGQTTNARLTFALLQAVMLCVIFLPMLYWLDKMRFNRYEINTSGGKSTPAKRTRAGAGADVADNGAAAPDSGDHLETIEGEEA